MDLFKKFFGIDGNKKDEKHPALADEFRKPIWTEGYDTDDDDELFENNSKMFGFQMFTNPLELQKHFDKQMLEMLKALEEEGSVQVFDHSVRDEYLKPGFENELNKELQKKKYIDTDLDGEIYADQLHTLLQRISPELKAMLPSARDKSEKQDQRNRTDEEIIMDRLQGKNDEAAVVKPKTSSPTAKPNGVFGGSFQGPKMFGQSIISQTVRRPDGTYETRRTVRDSEGNTKTTVTRSNQDGKVETITSDEAPQIKFSDDVLRFAQPSTSKVEQQPIASLDTRYYYVNKGGYTLPKNIW